MKFYFKSVLCSFAFFFAANTMHSQTVSSASGSASSIKYEGANAYSYTLSGLSTTAEADSLESIFKARPGIVEIMIDLPVHKITVYAPENMPETDIWEVIKYAGKTIITNPKEVSKYY